MEDVDPFDIPPKTEIVPRTEFVGTRPKSEAMQLSDIAKIEDQLYAQVAEVCAASMRFMDVDATAEKPPPEWVREYGSEEAAMRVFRVAKAAWGSAKDAPVALKYAHTTMVGMAHAKSKEKMGARALNMIYVDMRGAPGPEYPVKEVKT